MKNSQTKNNISTKKLLYLHTDLACECIPASQNAEGVCHKQFNLGEYEVCETEITSDNGEKITGRKKGKYISLFCPSLSLTQNLCAHELSDALKTLICNFTDYMGFDITPSSSILIAALGNRFITSDAIGPRTADKLLATHQLKLENKSFSRLGVPSIAVIAPGVASQTGIDAAHIIKAAAKSVKADFIIAIDALAARSTERLCATIQLSDGGIHPGSGIGNHRSPITKESMGIPVMALGIPTVISSSTLIFDALEKAKLDDFSPELEAILENGKGFFVSPGDSDTFCEDASDVLSDAINQAFLSKLYM
ncbi:MAG: GPR endopeptidase [Clostridia bacterium]|nr:GPR endopeptidase [Clostridia bacterium]